MHYRDYYERVEYDAEAKNVRVFVFYNFDGVEFKREVVVKGVSDAHAKLRELRSEFRDQVKGQADEKVLSGPNLIV